MSVLKERRKESKAEFVNTAHKIYIQTIQFLSRISARYSRLIAQPIAELAAEVSNNAAKANKTFPSDHVRVELREKYLLEARAALDALDTSLGDCYDLMMKNPSGCFTSSGERSIGPKEAAKRLENMAQEIGELIDREDDMLANVLKSDKERLRERLEK